MQAILHLFANKQEFIIAVAALLVAVRALATSKRDLHAQVTPILKVEYKFNDKKLKLKNVGLGPALNINLQASQLHYWDIKKVIKFSFAKDQSLTLYKDESKEFEIQPSEYTGEFDGPGGGFNLFRFIDSIGKKKVLGIIYSDIHRKKFLLQFKFVENGQGEYFANLLNIRSYGKLYFLYDCLNAWFYRRLKVIRELRYSYLEKRGKLIQD